MGAMPVASGAWVEENVNGLNQITIKANKAPKRSKAELITSIKYENGAGKQQAVYPFKAMDDPSRGRNNVNRSLCYDSNQSSMHNNVTAPWLNQSFDYTSGGAINTNQKFVYMTQASKS